MLAGLLLLVSQLLALASAANLTYDDTAPGWTFSPASVFGEISPTNHCDQCTSQPNPSFAMRQTWRDCTQQGTATLRFEGVGVTLFTICPGPHQGGQYIGHFAFTLDGKPQPDFKEDPAGCATYKYNYPVYTVGGLEPGVHTISITNAAVDTSNLLLDYAVVDDGAKAQAATSNKVPVAAVVVPVLLVLVVSAAGVFWLVRRKRRMQKQATLEAVDPLPYKPITSMSSQGAIPMSAYASEQQRAPDAAAASALTHVQRAGGDPELEAALHIIAQRARSNYPLPAPPSPTSPTGPSGAWPRDRKGLRPGPGNQTAAPQSSSVGANWSADVDAPSTVRSDVVEHDTTPPAYSDVTRRSE